MATLCRRYSIIERLFRSRCRRVNSDVLHWLLAFCYNALQGSEPMGEAVDVDRGPPSSGMPGEPEWNRNRNYWAVASPVKIPPGKRS